MIDVQRKPMVTTIRCGDCQATAQIFTDDKRLVERRIRQFQQSHCCNLSALSHQPQAKES